MGSNILHPPQVIDFRRNDDNNQNNEYRAMSIVKVEFKTFSMDASGVSILKSSNFTFAYSQIHRLGHDGLAVAKKP